MKSWTFPKIIRPHLTVGGVILGVILIWVLCYYSIASQIGKAFPGFFYSPDGIISSFTPQDFSGWKAGLRPGDRIVAVDNQPWSQMPRLMKASRIGDVHVYIIERNGNRHLISVPTMVFSADLIWRFIPGFAFCGLLCLGIGIFIYLENPDAVLNRYTFLYLSLYTGFLLVWEFYLSQIKWTSYLVQPWLAIICVVGWIFFWRFPGDEKRNTLLASRPIIPAFIILAIVATIFYPTMFFLTKRIDQPALWRMYTFQATWVSFIIFGGGTVLNKTLPPLLILRDKSTPTLIRQQAVTMLVGISISISGFLPCFWAPFMIHFPPPVNPQWGAVIASIYPLAIGYAVLRYRLFDIRIVLRKGLVYSLLTTILTAIFLSLSLLSGQVYQTITGQQSFISALIPALLVAFLFQPVRNRIQIFVDRAFFRHEYEIRLTLTEFSKSLSTLHACDEVVYLVVNTVIEYLGASAAKLWIRKDNYFLVHPSNPISPESSIAGQGIIPVEGNLPSWLAQERRPFIFENRDSSDKVMDLHQPLGNLAVPLIAGEQLVGILTLDSKRSGDPYSQLDLDLLSMIAHSTALSLENARLHEERISILRRQLNAITLAQEEERKRIARELHDSIGPAFANMNIRLQTVCKLLQRDQDLAITEIDQITELAQAGVRDIRRLIYDLRPAVLDELGLEPALREFIARCQRDYELSIQFDAHADMRPTQTDRLPATIETAVFRIVQEAIYNIVQHAQATQVNVVLNKENNKICISIIDNGQGFDVQSPQSNDHLGLWSMRERAEQLGGGFEIKSIKGKGVTIFAWIPLYVEVIEKWMKSGY